MWIRKQDQLIAIQFAPGACVSIAKLHKVNGTIKLVLPIPGLNPILARIDLHEAAGSDERIQGVVLNSDVTIEGVLQIQTLQQCDGHLTPLLEHPRDEIGAFDLDILAEFERRRDG